MQQRTAAETDQRLGLMSELISAVAVIKMFVWQEWIKSRILSARQKELQLILKTGLIRGIYMTLSLFVSRLMICATLLAMATTPRNSLTAANVFMVSAYFTLLTHAVGQMFVRGVTELAAVRVSLQRLQKFLLAEEKGEQCDKKPSEVTNETLPSIRIQNCTAYWNHQVRLVDSKTMLLFKNSAPTLSNISLPETTGPCLVGIVGTVASGKSSLLELLLGELPITLGVVKVFGRVSYAPQEPWLFDGTIRENIVFGEVWDESRYASVIDHCALVDDLQQFPNNDQTVVGERGATLSGGQRGRVSLARTIYRRADVYLLDDPLCSVDENVGRHLFERIFSNTGFLGDKMRVLVINKKECLQQMDWIVLMNEVGGLHKIS